MSVASDDEQALSKEREAFVTGMKARIEEARASGQSPEEIREQVTAYARVEARKQLPQTVAKLTAWWHGLRSFLIVGSLALGLGVGLALLIGHYYASPFCQPYATQHALVYQGIDYPVLGKSSSTTSSGSCIFVDTAGRRTTIRLSKLEPNAALSLLASFALDIEVTSPVLFVLVAFIAVAIGRLR